MEGIQAIVQWFSVNWVELGAAIVLIERGLTALSKLTPWEWDDNLVEVLSKITSSIFKKKA